MKLSRRTSSTGANPVGGRNEGAQGPVGAGGSGGSSPAEQNPGSGPGTGTGGAPGTGSPDSAGGQGPTGGGAGAEDSGLQYDIWHCPGCGEIWTEANSSVYEFAKYQAWSIAGEAAILRYVRPVAGLIGRMIPRPIEGIYEYTANVGRTYVGQSSNIDVRLATWMRKGKLLPEHFDTIRVTRVTGGKLAREIAEQLRIDELGGVRNLANVRNPIGNGAARLLKALMTEF